MESIPKGKSILITGGTGTLGSEWLFYAIKNLSYINRIIVFSRDEFKQYELQQKLLYMKLPFHVQFEIGDIRDVNRVLQVMKGVDYVIHAAALKHVPLGEIFPSEFIKTNILGAENLITAAEHCSVKKVIALSTSKAVVPLNLYGATKLCSDKLFLSQNERNINSDNTKYSIIRFGNIFNSRGSVVPLFLSQCKTGLLTITDPEMSRFSITSEQGARFISSVLSSMNGGEIFVPKTPSYDIRSLANAVSKEVEWKIIGLRPGEKLHEELITEFDAPNTIEFDDHFRIYPSGIVQKNLENGNKLTEKFSYTSQNNPQKLNEDDLRKLLTNS